MKEKLKLPVFLIIAETAKQENIQAFVIGGFVRDLILERPSQDIDVVVLGSGIDFAKKVAKNIGSTIEIISNETEEGQQFENLGGIGGILRFGI